MPAGRYSTFVDALSDRKKGPLWEAGKDYTHSNAMDDSEGDGLHSNWHDEHISLFAYAYPRGAG